MGWPDKCVNNQKVIYENGIFAIPLTFAGRGGFQPSGHAVSRDMLMTGLSMGLMEKQLAGMWAVAAHR